MSELERDSWETRYRKVIDERNTAFRRAEVAEQERDSVQFALDSFRQVAQKDNEYLIARAEAAERRTADFLDQLVTQRRRVAELEAAVFTLADEWERVADGEYVSVDSLRPGLRALVSDPTALDRIRREAVEAALAPIEALAESAPSAKLSDDFLEGWWLCCERLSAALADARGAAKEAER